MMRFLYIVVSLLLAGGASAAMAEPGSDTAAAIRRLEAAVAAQSAQLDIYSLRTQFSF